MANVKMTKKVVATALVNFFEGYDVEEILSTVDDIEVSVDDAVNYLNREIELLSKKKAGKASKKTLELNNKLKATITDVLQNADKPKTVTEILGDGDFESGVSNQKITAMLRQMVADDLVIRSDDKGKSPRFSLA